MPARMHFLDGIRRVTARPYATAAVATVAVVVYLVIRGQRYGLDLAVYRDGVHAWASGRDPYPLKFTEVGLFYTYPPLSLLALSPLALAPFGMTLWLLWAASLAAVTGSIVLVLRDLGAAVTRGLATWVFACACLLALALEPARSAIGFGQIEFILMFVVVADLLAAKPPWRGIGIGLAAAVKLTPLAFIIVLLVSRDLKSAARAVLSFLAGTGLCWLIWPQQSDLFWFHDVDDPNRVGGVTYRTNQCWYAVLHRLPLSASGAELAWLLLSLVTLTASTFVAWRCVNAGHKAPAVVAVALAGLLISPVSWSHHWVWVMLVPALLLRLRPPDLGRAVRLMLYGLVALTALSPYWWFSSGTGADIAEAVLPAWTLATLLAWSATAFACWRRQPTPARDRSRLGGALLSGTRLR